MRTKKLFKTRVITKTVREGLTEAEFLEAIQRDKPTGIYCRPWSDKKPLFVITRYMKTGLKYYCNARWDAKPTWVPYKGFYKICRNGMSALYYLVPAKTATDSRAGADGNLR